MLLRVWLGKKVGVEDVLLDPSVCGTTPSTPGVCVVTLGAAEEGEDVIELGTVLVAEEDTAEEELDSVKVAVIPGTAGSLQATG